LKQKLFYFDNFNDYNNFYTINVHAWSEFKIRIGIVAIGCGGLGRVRKDWEREGVRKEENEEKLNRPQYYNFL